MTTTLLPEIEFEAAQRVRVATLLERAVHGAGNWTMEDALMSFCVELRHEVIDGVPKFVGTYEGEGQYVDRFALCHEGDPVRWFTLGMALTNGDEVVVDFT